MVNSMFVFRLALREGGGATMMMIRGELLRKNVWPQWCFTTIKYRIQNKIRKIAGKMRSAWRFLKFGSYFQSQCSHKKFFLYNFRLSGEPGTPSPYRRIIKSCTGVVGGHRSQRRPSEALPWPLSWREPRCLAMTGASASPSCRSRSRNITR